MARKTAKKTGVKKDVKEIIVAAALALAVEKGWSNTSLSDIAKKAKISLAALQEHCQDKADIIALLGRQIDNKVLKATQDGDGSSPRDRLFEVMMARFDVLQEYRIGLVAILDSLLYDPKDALLGLPHLCRSMNWMLEVSGVETGGMKGAAKVLGLAGIYLKILKDWKEDESEDLARTMASLDQALGHAETIVTRLGL